ncbi:uncharacterized protein LOC100908064 [Galendromus occidentalis]|uniref:Uncharacterized protein LOC100908064 n=1 Tax=Galendromus occidentalis TaxID=34638 RepID=A0AAJ6VW92_9ACAR|nr:uncharacterized protein LOC100908064 [Galendromus occidentalis]
MLVIYVKKLYLETEHDAIVSMFSVIMPLFFKVYPDWVILHVDKQELTPALKMLYALCCEHFSWEGGLILVEGEPAQFSYPKEQFTYSKTTVLRNIQEACHSLKFEVNRFLGPLPILNQLPLPETKVE